MHKGPDMSQDAGGDPAMALFGGTQPVQPPGTKTIERRVRALQVVRGEIPLDQMTKTECEGLNLPQALKDQWREIKRAAGKTFKPSVNNEGLTAWQLVYGNNPF